MTYDEAIDRLGKDFKVRRLAWAKDAYVRPSWLGPNVKTFTARFCWRGNRQGIPFLPEAEDRNATDWVEYAPKRA